MLQVKGKCVRVINIRELILIFIIIYSFISLASCSKESPVESRKQLIGEFRTFFIRRWNQYARVYLQ
jgi:hypothetical protein